MKWTKSFGGDKIEGNIELEFHNKECKEQEFLNTGWDTFYKCLIVTYIFVFLIVSFCIQYARSCTLLWLFLIFTLGLVVFIGMNYKFMIHQTAHKIDETKAISVLKRKLIEDAIIRDVKLQEKSKEKSKEESKTDNKEDAANKPTSETNQTPETKKVG